MSDNDDFAAGDVISSRSPSPEFAPTKKAPAKRKSTGAAAGGSKAKKARTSTSTVDPYAQTRELIAAVIANPAGYGEDVVRLAQYAHALQTGAVSAPKPKKNAEQLEKDVEKIKTAAYRGIKAQFKWRPSCKTGGARWSYDGFCPDPEVFARMMGLEGPPKWKQKKFGKDEFEDRIGRIVGSARYNDMYILGDVNVRYNGESGEFKMTGSYGVPSVPKY
ncbi:unnamed protein product [Peniophora sp. CBMAI 1063]|nr:unnamed protein product [Peniophora sp. CBMAI 1063]